LRIRITQIRIRAACRDQDQRGAEQDQTGLDQDHACEERDHAGKDGSNR
jgi:hypothetical protein